MIKTTEENGGILGVDNTPTRAVASGIWGLNSVFDARTAGIWPVAPLYDYPIENSLRFDGSSYLSRTFGSGNQQTWTWSGWVKRSSLGEQFIFGTGSSSDSSNYYYFQFGGSDNPMFSNWAGTINVRANNVLRDSSSWYHLVLSFTSTNIDIFINGTEYSYAVTSQPSSSTSINSNREHYIGVRYSGVAHLNGYIANIQFIDGQALDPYFFGESKNGVWIPYNAFSTAGSGTATASDGDTATDSYGTNGFHLTFEDATSTTTLGYDYSGNNNHWTLN